MGKPEDSDVLGTWEVKVPLSASGGHHPLLSAHSSKSSAAKAGIRPFVADVV